MESTVQESTETRDVLLTPGEVQEILKVAPTTLTNWRSRREGPPWIKVSGQMGVPGGEIRYPERDLYAYLKARTVRPRPGAQKAAS